MNDPTDTALAVCATLAVVLCGACGFWTAWRHRQGSPQGMKASPSMEHLAEDPGNNV